MSISQRNNCININLQDGRSVNIGTKEGANQFILQGVTRDPNDLGFAHSPCRFFSQNIGKITVVCDSIYERRNKKPTQQEINMISAMYTVTSQLAQNADYDVIDDIPLHEVKLYFDHVLVEIGRMTEASSNWARTGNLKYPNERALLQSLMVLLTQRKPARLALETDLYGTVARFASTPSSMNEDAAEMVTMIVANFVSSTLVHEGMLEQFIRLSVVSPMSNPVVLKCYDDLLDCILLIEEKFTEDQPCGKACKEILGRSSLNRHPVVGKLRMIASYTSSIEKRADFPKEVNEESVSIFVQKNYVGILKEIVKVSNETGKSKGDLLLELDFYNSDKNGRSAPASRTPPQIIKVAESRGYFDGSRPNKNIDREILKDSYNFLTDNHLLVLVRLDNSGFKVYRVRLQSPTTKNYLFSQDTINAATKAIQDRNFGPLSSLFGVGSDETRRLCRALGGRPDDDEIVDLNTFLWDQLLSD